MDKGTVSIQEILEHMDAGLPFSMIYVKADRKRGTGGQMVSVERAHKSGHNLKDGQRVTPSAIKKAAKNPNHSQHFTRNIVLPDREVRTVHPDLIITFNGKEVT